MCAAYQSVICVGEVESEEERKSRSIIRCRVDRSQRLITLCLGRDEDLWMHVDRLMGRRQRRICELCGSEHYIYPL